MPDYLVKIADTARRPDDDEPPVTERLVRAKNRAGALARVVADTITVERASTDDLVRLTKAGVELETAK